MKFLKYSLVFFAILVIGFFLAGFLKPILSYDCEVIVNKPINEAFAVSQDENKMKDWLEGFEKMVQISGTPGSEGAVADVYFSTDGEEMIIRETIKAIGPAESVKMLFESEFMDMDYTLSMKSVDDKTIINTSSFVEGNGMFSKSIVTLLGNSFVTQEETNLYNLKKTIESNTNNYSFLKE